MGECNRRATAITGRYRREIPGIRRHRCIDIEYGRTVGYRLLAAQHLWTISIAAAAILLGDGGAGFKGTVGGAGAQRYVTRCRLMTEQFCLLNDPQ